MRLEGSRRCQYITLGDKDRWQEQISYRHRDGAGVDAVVEVQSWVVRADCVGGGFSLSI